MRHAIVVGGGSGIGLACAEALASHGWATNVLDLRKPEQAPAGVHGFTLVDVRDHDAVESALDACVHEVGHAPSGVVYAAGVARIAPILEIEETSWDLVLDVNLRGAFSVLGASARRMQAARLGGALVFVSSVDADHPVPGLAHYCAAKAGLESLVRSAALELGPSGIRVNAVAPGVVETPLMEPLLRRDEVRQAFLERIPLGRIAVPTDIASAITFLLSDNASWITGQTLKVDGGMTLREHPNLLQLIDPNRVQG